jgi:hypothetical protein
VIDERSVWLPSPDQVQGDRTIGFGAKISMPGLGAKVGQIDPGHRVGGSDTENPANRHVEEPLPCPQDGKGAKKPLAIDDIVPAGHRGGVPTTGGRGKVSARPRGSDPRAG